MDRDNFIVLFVLVDHLHHTYCLRSHDAEGRNLKLSENEHVQRVMIVTISPRQESVVSRVVDRAVENTVDSQKTGLFIQLVFDRGADRDFDHAVEDHWDLGSQFDIMPGVHALLP